MAERISALLTSYRSDPAPFRARACPALVWEMAPRLKEKPELMWVTQGNYKLEPPSNDPLVFDVEKLNRKLNGFLLGITLGRTSNNDIALDDGSVSRFHAFFQRDEHTGVWHVVDAESFNGTFLAGTRIQPGRPAPLHDESDLQFGNVAVKFLSAKAFEAYLLEKSRAR